MLGRKSTESELEALPPLSRIWKEALARFLGLLSAIKTREFHTVAGHVAFWLYSYSISGCGTLDPGQKGPRLVMTESMNATCVDGPTEHLGRG